MIFYGTGKSTRIHRTLQQEAPKAEEPTADVKKKSFCPYCGAKLDGDYRFCPFCGEKMEE